MSSGCFSSLFLYDQNEHLCRLFFGLSQPVQKPRPRMATKNIVTVDGQFSPGEKKG